MDLFRGLWEQGRTVIVIAHDAALARRASRVVEVRDGLITSGGSPARTREAAAAAESASV
jgi:predicted ABC-type transport system involved in lysophospholipase L1 biosynthesis ATPase subunit